MVAFLVWDQAVAGSSPVTSTNEKSPLTYNKLADFFVISFSECDRAVAHATRRGDGRQEGGERGYYNLHRNLNQSLLLHNI